MAEDAKPTNEDLLRAITKLNEDMKKGFTEISEEFEAVDDRFSQLELKLNLDPLDQTVVLRKTIE